MSSLPIANELLSAHPAYQYAAVLILKEEKSTTQIVELLQRQGFEYEEVSTLVNQLQKTYIRLKKNQAKREVAYAGLWCTGSIIATMAHVSLLFWAAILISCAQLGKALKHIRLFL